MWPLEVIFHDRLVQGGTSSLGGKATLAFLQGLGEVGWPSCRNDKHPREAPAKSNGMRSHPEVATPGRCAEMSLDLDQEYSESLRDRLTDCRPVWQKVSKKQGSESWQAGFLHHRD